MYTKYIWWQPQSWKMHTQNSSTHGWNTTHLPTLDSSKFAAFQLLIWSGRNSCSFSVSATLERS